MSSSAKYYKFQVTQDENKDSSDREKNTKWLKIGLIMIAIILVTVAIATTLAVGVGVGVSVSQSEAQTGLSVITVTQAELKGEYHSPEGSILFHSTVNNTHIVLSIFTKNGELVVTIKHPLMTNMTLMGVNKTNFLVMEDQPGRLKYDDYLVPEDMMNTMNSMMSDSGEEMTDDMLERLDNSTVNETRITVFHDLAMSPHAQLIIDAAMALGKLGVMGTDYPAVMQFYQLALQLTHIREFIEGESSDDELSLQSRELRSDYGQQFIRKRSVRCNNGARCQSNRCPFNRYNNPCFGMCGKGCDCWTFVCGNCCVHEYCHTHDQCCHDRGFYSWACLSAAWKWPRCSRRYRC